MVYIDYLLDCAVHRELAPVSHKNTMTFPSQHPLLHTQSHIMIVLSPVSCDSPSLWSLPWRKTGTAVAGNISFRHRRVTTVEYKPCCPGKKISPFPYRTVQCTVQFHSLYVLRGSHLADIELYSGVETGLHRRALFSPVSDPILFTYR